MSSNRTVTAAPTSGPDGTICPITEMPTAWCAHCRDGNRFHRGLRDKMQRPPNQIGIRVRYQFTARHIGVCHHCGGTIEVGKPAGVTSDAETVCARCL